VSDAAGFKKHCADKGGLCAVAMLNGAPSADAERQAQLEMLKRVAARPDSKAFTVVWVDAVCQGAFADAFNVQSTKASRQSRPRPPARTCMRARAVASEYGPWVHHGTLC
jgi:hypothetical protein